MRRCNLISLLVLVAGCSTNVNLSLLPSAKPQHVTASADGVPNLSIVDQQQHIYRGGQPSQAGWEWLADRGVTNVVKLNLEGEGSDSPAEVLGMSVNRYPIDTWQQLWGPCNRQLEEAAARIGPRTYVHCLHGQDRTGACVFRYRMLLAEGHQAEAYTNAVNEMLGLGFHKELHALWEYVADYQQH